MTALEAWEHPTEMMTVSAGFRETKYFCLGVRKHAEVRGKSGRTDDEKEVKVIKKKGIKLSSNEFWFSIVFIVVIPQRQLKNSLSGKKFLETFDNFEKNLLKKYLGRVPPYGKYVNKSLFRKQTVNLRKNSQQTKLQLLNFSLQGDLPQIHLHAFCFSWKFYSLRIFF